MENIKDIKKAKYIKHIGNIYLNSLCVCAYKTSNPDYIMLIAETARGNVVSSSNNKKIAAIATITNKEFEEEFENYVGTKVLLDAFKKVGIEID